MSLDESCNISFWSSEMKSNHSVRISRFHQSFDLISFSGQRSEMRLDKFFLLFSEKFFSKWKTFLVQFILELFNLRVFLSDWKILWMNFFSEIVIFNLKPFDRFVPSFLWWRLINELFLLNWHSDILGDKN